MPASDSGISNGSAAAGPTAIAITSFLSLALYNVLELNFIIFATFKKRRGLYFWSFLVSTWGIAAYSVGFLLKDFQLSTLNILYVTLIAIGWCCMVTGQSVVLYSRLHLLLRNQKTLRMVLIMIVFDAIICHGPIIVMVYGANSNNPDPFILPYSIYEKVQVTIFFLQELIISGLYVIETTKLFRLESSIHGRSSRRIMSHLIVVNIIIIVLDITILALEYSGLYDIQTSYKGLVYSVKLKLEFSILNRLVELTRARNGSSYIHSVENGGIHMETHHGERQKRLGKDKKGFGYRASVHGGRGGDDNADDSVKNNGSVFMTTEVVIHREGIAMDHGSEQDLESVDNRSAVTRESTGGGIGDGAGIPSSSSQVQFARTWE